MTDTLITHEVISIIESPADSIHLTSLLSLMGSIKAPVNLYIKPIASILIIGNNIIVTKITRPTLLSAFFRRSEYPATVDIASDKLFPTTGTKLSMANFTVFSATASIVLVVKPRIVITPINIVIIIPWIQRTDLFNSPDNFSIL